MLPIWKAAVGIERHPVGGSLRLPVAKRDAYRIPGGDLDRRTALLDVGKHIGEQRGKEQED